MYLVDILHCGIVRLSFPFALCDGQVGHHRLDENPAMELGPDGIRVNGLCPGSVEGPRMDRVVANEAPLGLSEQEAQRSLCHWSFVKTWVTADDIADMALFLTSEASQKSPVRRCASMAIPNPKRMRPL